MEDPEDGDGCVNSIFPVLAQKRLDPQGRPRPFCQCLVAPTVTYHYQTKSFWYYTQPGDQELRTKTKSELANQNIIQVFKTETFMLRNYKPRSEIVAVCV
jgi:hypothetical protein